MLCIKGDLLGATAFGLVNGAAHRIGNAIGIQDCLAIHIARSPTDGLNQAAFRAQKAFLIGIQNSNQRHLGNIETLSQQVNPNQDIKCAEP